MRTILDTMSQYMNSTIRAVPLWLTTTTPEDPVRGQSGYKQRVVVVRGQGGDKRGSFVSFIIQRSVRGNICYVSAYI